MTLVYTADLALYRAAYRLLRRKSFLRRYGLIISVLVVSASFGLLLFLHSGDVAHQIRLVKEFLFIAIIYLALGGSEYLFLPGQHFRRIHKAPNSPAPSITEITSEHIRDAMPNKPETRYAWTEVTGFAQDSKATLIYRNGRFTFFPTCAMTTEQQAELDQLVSHYGIRRWTC